MEIDPLREAQSSHERKKRRDKKAAAAQQTKDVAKPFNESAQGCTESRPDDILETLEIPKKVESVMGSDGIADVPEPKWEIILELTSRMKLLTSFRLLR
jgi:hypothetical protein